MKKIAIVMFVLLQASCLTQRKTDEELKKRIAKMEVKMAEYEKHQTVDKWQLSKECANQAASFYKQGGYDDKSHKTSNFYINHWNNKMGKCFIQVTSTSPKDDFLSIDIFDAVEGKHYALYIGHNICDVSITGDPKKCQFDAGMIWFDGNDVGKRPDYHVGFQGITVGPGVGDKNTQKQFIDHIQPLITE